MQRRNSKGFENKKYIQKNLITFLIICYKYHPKTNTTFLCAPRPNLRDTTCLKLTCGVSFFIVF